MSRRRNHFKKPSFKNSIVVVVVVLMIVGEVSELIVDSHIRLLVRL